MSCIEDFLETWVPEYKTRKGKCEQFGVSTTDGSSRKFHIRSYWALRLQVPIVGSIYERPQGKLPMYLLHVGASVVTVLDYLGFALKIDESFQDISRAVPDVWGHRNTMSCCKRYLQQVQASAPIGVSTIVFVFSLAAYCDFFSSVKLEVSEIMPFLAAE